MVVPTDGGELTRELLVLGWDERALDRALALRGRAADAGCHSVGRVAIAALIDGLEADPLIELHQRTGEPHADDIEAEMLQRDGFVGFLANVIATGSVEDVRRLADQLPVDPEVQSPLRAGAAGRLSSLLTSAALMTDGDYLRLHVLEDAWPEETMSHLIRRLDADESIRDVLFLLRSTTDEHFDAHRAELRAAVMRRCHPLVEGRIRDLCAELRARPDGVDGLLLHGTGRTAWGSSHCGLAEPPECDAYARDWEWLRHELGPTHVIWL